MATDLFRPENCTLLNDGNNNCTYANETNWEELMQQVDAEILKMENEIKNDPGVIFAIELYKAAEIRMVKFVFVMMALVFTVMILYVETRFGGMFGRKKKGGSS